MINKCLFFIFLLIGINAFAINIPDKPDSRVIDQTNSLTLEQRQILVNALDKIYATESRTEIQVLMIPSLDNEPIEDVSLRIARKWKIGQKGTNNGALILIAVKDHKYRVEVGYGLEGVLPDGYIGNLERDIMTPYFAKNDFFNGLNLALNKLSQQISKDYKTTSNTGNLQLSSKSAIMYVLIGIGVFVLIAIFSFAGGNPERILGVLWFILKIVTLAALFRGSDRRGGRDDDIGGGGGFGGGGSSNKW
ncbi:MAG: beta-propeller domain of methanol dehydrogenase type [Burkholderiales bacterium]|jgi:uncharacterized protein|nr:beta-propeller domain of methanol dehydrogenase type [Burkholderiales bacterium]